jgi:predicted ATP-dependent endonuclease of OLD family
MYLYKLQLKNFRNFKELTWFPNKERNVIIGPNGSGKSSIAAALDYLLNPYMQWFRRRLPASDYLNRDTSKEILIEAWFKDLEEFIGDDNDLFLQHVNQDKIDENGNEIALIIRLTAGADLIPEHHIVSNGIKHKLTQKQKDSIGFLLINGDRTPEEDMSFSSNSIMSKRITNEQFGETIQNIIEKYKQYTSHELRENIEFMGIMDNLSKNFYDFNLADAPSNSVTVEPLELTERKTLQTFSLVVKNSESSIPLKNHSKGIKNAMLLLTLAEEFRNKGILYIEEPEQNLEPQLQRRLISNLRETCSGQLFVTTHSTDVVKKFSFDEMFIVSTNSIVPIPNVSRINPSLWKRYEKFEKTEIIDGLFSNAVLIVEGASEYGAFPIFSDLIEYGFDYSGVKLICAEGKPNMQFFAKFYADCGKKVICLLDNDSDISITIKDIKRESPSAYIILQNVDYEETLLELELVKQKWDKMFEQFLPFLKYKDRYFKPFGEKSKSPELKIIEIDEDKTKYTSVDDIKLLLNPSQEKAYIREFLHTNFAGVLESKNIAIYLSNNYESIDDNPYPISFLQLVNIVNVLTGNKKGCKNALNCRINAEADFFCNDCMIKQEERVFIIKGVV